MHPQADPKRVFVNCTLSKWNSLLVNHFCHPPFVSWMKVEAFLNSAHWSPKHRSQKYADPRDLEMDCWCPSGQMKSAKQTEGRRVTHPSYPELSSSGSPVIRCHRYGTLHKYRGVRKDEIWPVVPGRGTQTRTHLQIKYSVGKSESKPATFTSKAFNGFRS